MDLLSLNCDKFVQFALQEASNRTNLVPLHSQERFKNLSTNDKKTAVSTISFSAPKIRHLRSMNINGGRTMQVLDLCIFPEAQFNVPIFCANFFASPAMSIVVLDLNPLHGAMTQGGHMDGHYEKLLPICQQYAEFFPWGGKITFESVRFFSPVVIWSKFTPSLDRHEALFSAFMEYLKIWFEMLEQSSEETDPDSVHLNRQAQHRYLTWRAEKDPGYPLLKKLFGESLAKDLVENFLFDGVNYLGSKQFLDYFPEYRVSDGTLNQRRSVVGKSFETRPWDDRGNFIGC
ncbi:phytochromobilin:ferredoxin oxidoreductase, chloroplast / phytochromobilin synthase (HY2) [Wolffia australiana]